MYTSFNLPIAILCSVLTVLSLFLPVEAADYQSDRFQQIYARYQQVANDEGGSSRQVVKTLRQFYDEDTSDPLVLVLLGSAQTLMGRDALLPWSKMRHTEKGLEAMSLAVRFIQPEHEQQIFQGMSVALHVQTLAGITFSQVPAFFGRQEEGYDLLAQVLSETDFRRLPGAAKTYVYFYAIEAAVSLNESAQAKIWQKEVEALAVEDRYSQAALSREIQ